MEGRILAHGMGKSILPEAGEMLRVHTVHPHGFRDEGMDGIAIRAAQEPAHFIQELALIGHLLGGFAAVHGPGEQRLRKPIAAGEDGEGDEQPGLNGGERGGVKGAAEDLC